MRKTVLILSIAVLSLFVTSVVIAATWTIPANVKIVQKTAASGVYTSIRAALASIPAGSPSADNPFVIKVMPGVYDEGQINMRSYVDIEGMGRESTIINSDVSNVDFDTCTAGTIVMAPNSAIRNLRVKNYAATQNLAAGIVFNNVEAKAEMIDVSVGDSDTFNARNAGICSTGTQGHAILNNIFVEVHNATDGHSNPIMALADGNVTLSNSKLLAFSTGDIGDIYAIDCVYGNGLGTVKVDNSYIEGTAGTGVVTMLHIDDCKASISDSILNPLNGGWIGTVTARYDFSIVNTQIFTGPGGTSISWAASGTAKIANNLIQGGLGSIDNLSNMKLFNNYDENFNMIPNQ